MDMGKIVKSNQRWSRKSHLETCFQYFVSL